MPVYEYRCDACNIQFELRQKFSDPPADKCPKCGGTVRKLVSAASFSLKGAGWYGDGYGSKVEPTKPEGDTAVGTEPGTAEVGTTKEKGSTDAAPAETTASPATQVPATTQADTKSKAAETPTTTKDKTVVKTQSD
ncbi:MAG: zinc ribbon domain-containing protein [Desulfuromonadales bacterium]